MKTVEQITEELGKKHGKGTFFMLTDKPDTPKIGVSSSGSLLLDRQLGGGYAKGRIVEIYGPESSGKTTLALHAIAEVQKNGGKAAFIDVEHALDLEYALALGCTRENFGISQPSHGEQALEILDNLLDGGVFDIIVLDSVAALVPKAELEGEMGDSKMGLHARLMSQAMRKITAKVNKSNTIVIFINQLRMKIGVMFGSPEVTTGGNALKYYSSQRLDVRKIGKPLTNKAGELLGQVMKIKVVKNKVAPPFGIIETELHYGLGISRESEVLDLSLENCQLKKSGAWYSYEGANIAQGRPNAVQFLKDHPELLEKLERKLNEDTSD